MKGRVLQVTQQLGKTVAEPVKNSEKLDFHALNALLNLYDEDGKIQFDNDRESANQYYEPEVIEAYDWEFIKSLFKRAYSFKFRFKSFLGAYKYYTSYTLKTFDGRRYLERFEDRVSMTALFLADGDTAVAESMVDEIM